MATIGRLSISLLANTAQFARSMNQATEQLETVGVEAEKTSSRFKGMASSAIKAGAAIVGIGSAAGALSFGVKLAAEMEQSTIAFTTMLGSADKAQRLLRQLRDFAVETPFELPELVEAARSLVAFGVSSEQILPTLRSLGDIASGIGMPVKELAELYGKAKVQGRLFAMDINQLTNRGIPIIGALAKQFGVAESEIKRLVEEGKVGFDELQRAMFGLAGSGGQFAGMMEAQSQSLSGLFSTLKDSIGEFLRGMGEAFTKSAGVSENIKRLTGSIEGLASSGQALGAILGTVAGTLASIAFEVASWGTTAAATIIVLGSLTAALMTMQAAAWTIFKLKLVWWLATTAAQTKLLSTVISVATLKTKAYAAMTAIATVAQGAFTKSTNASTLATFVKMLTDAASAITKVRLATILATAAQWLYIVATKALIVAKIVLLSLLGPKGWAILAASAAIAALAIWNVKRALDGTMESANGIGTLTIGNGISATPHDFYEADRKQIEANYRAGLITWAQKERALQGAKQALEKELALQQQIMAEESARAKLDRQRAEGESLLNGLIEDGLKLNEEMRDPLEKHIAAMDRLNMMREAGTITDETYMRRKAQLQKELEESDPAHSAIASLTEQNAILTAQVNTWSDAIGYAEEYRLRLAGATEEQIKAAKALAEQNELLRKERELQKDIDRRVEQANVAFQSPLDKFADDMAKLEEIKAKLDPATFARNSQGIKNNLLSSMGLDDLSPMDKFRKKLEDLHKLRATLGEDGKQVFQMGVAQAISELESATALARMESPEALVKGSSAEISALNQAANQASPLNRIENILKRAEQFEQRQAAAAERSAKQLEALNGKFGVPPG